MTEKRFTNCIFILWRFVLFSWFNGISTFVGYLIQKPSFFKDGSGGGDRNVYTFQKVTSLNGNLTIRVDFELALFDFGFNVY